jgi:hypothetical protein
LVAVATSLALYLTGLSTMQETVTGLGDPVVVMIAALSPSRWGWRPAASAPGRASFSSVAWGNASFLTPFATASA